MNEFLIEFAKGVCRAIPVGIGIYIGMHFGVKALQEVLRGKIELSQTINIIGKRNQKEGNSHDQKAS